MFIKVGVINAKILGCLLPLIFIFSGCASTKQVSENFFLPIDLRVELLKGAWVRNVNDSQPEFSWTIAGEKDSAQQKAYRIQLWDMSTATKSKLIWDSGQQFSAQSSAVSYAGESLQKNTDYRWQVKVWLDTKSGHNIESPWSAAQTFTTSGTMTNQASQHDTVTTVVPPKYVKRLPSGRYLIDFGKVAFGYLELSLNSEKAGHINVHLAERGDENGAYSDFDKKSSVRYYTVPVQVYAKKDTYAVHPPKNKRNTKAEKAIPIPGRFGRITPFRFVEIDAGELNISDISANQIALHYPFDPYASHFSSSNDTLNAIWDLSKYSMKATSFAGIYVDGDRERIPYEADAYINQLSHYLVDDEYSLARYSHEYLMNHPTWPTEWKQHSILMAWTDWMYTGDLESLEAYYSVLKEQKLLGFLANEQGLLVSHPNGTHQTSKDIVDWPVGERDGYDFRDINTVVNAFYYLNLNQMAQIAEALGKVEDANKFKQQAKTLYQVFNDTLYNTKTGLYIDGVGSGHSAAHANILPLAVGLVPDARKAKVIDFIKSKKMAVSVYFAQYLLEAMYLNGEAEYALSLMTSKQKRSWYNMIRVGSTISLEAWDDEFKPNQDWNHAWGSVPGNIVGRYILGVRPLTPGFENVHIAPQFAELSYVEGRVPTIKGPISVRMEQAVGQSVLLNVTIPNNVNAKISLPFAKNKAIEKVKLMGREVGFDAKTGELDQAMFSAGKYTIEVIYQ